MTQHCQSCIYQLYLTHVAIAHAQEYLTVSGAISLALRRKWAVLIHENNIFCAVNFERTQWSTSIKKQQLTQKWFLHIAWHFIYSGPTDYL